MSKKELSLENLFARPAGKGNSTDSTPVICRVDAVEATGKKNTFIINEDVQIRFDNFIKRSGIKRAVVVNVALTEYLEKHEKRV